MKSCWSKSHLHAMPSYLRQQEIQGWEEKSLKYTEILSSICQSVSLCFYFSLCLFHSLFLSVCMSLSPFISLSVLSLPLSLSLCFFLPSLLSLPHTMYIHTCLIQWYKRSRKSTKTRPLMFILFQALLAPYPTPDWLLIYFWSSWIQCLN